MNGYKVEESFLQNGNLVAYSEAKVEFAVQYLIKKEQEMKWLMYDMSRIISICEAAEQ